MTENYSHAFMSTATFIAKYFRMHMALYRKTSLH
jgi:hypothetical protein